MARESASNSCFGDRYYAGQQTHKLSGRLANAVSNLSDEARAALVAVLRTTFEPYLGPDGLAFPMEAHVVVARP